MPTLIATHEVDEVAHWLASSNRAEVFASVATDLRTFVDRPGPTRSGRVRTSLTWSPSTPCWRATPARRQ